jgi:S-DNA-T family DNA segregation ATPase FtsK/SpoIIIE
MRRKRKFISGVFLITLALFSGVSLWSYRSTDWGSFWNVDNLCGPLGATVAELLRRILGSTSSWVVVLFLGYRGIMDLAGIALKRHAKQITCLILLTWFSFTLAAAYGNPEAGGFVAVNTLYFLELLAGRIGSLIILFAAVIVILMVLFFGRFKALGEKIKNISFQRVNLPKIRRRAAKSTGNRAGVTRTVSSGGKLSGHIKAKKKLKITETQRHEKVADEGEGKEIDSIESSTPADLAPPPDSSILGSLGRKSFSFTKAELVKRSEVIEDKLADFGLRGRIREVRPGPVVTTFEYVPDSGVKVSQISNRADDLSLALAARSIRIQAPIPGKGAVGIEVPNPEPQIVTLKEMIDELPPGNQNLNFALGKTVDGRPYYADISGMPHLLIAGATGSGKSVCINSIILSLLLRHTPATCRFVMVDPKRLELISYNGIPHLLHHVITEPRDTMKVLKVMTSEMDRRYKVLAAAGVKNISSYNRKVKSDKLKVPADREQHKTLPYYITIIDELADIMVSLGKDIYKPITRLSQMARAVGIHLVFATQRPSVDIVTGLIKANFPCRIAFQVTSKTDSRTILDVNGAEKLLGNGDMLYLPKDLPVPKRLQGSYVSESDVERVASYWKKFQGEGGSIDLSAEDGGPEGINMEGEDDELFDKAKELIIIHQQGSISLLQRRLRIGYARAARLIDMLEQAGVVGPFEGSKARKVLVSREEYEEL